MKIAYLVTALGRGGTEHWVELAAGELARRGHQVTVIGEHPPHDRRGRLEELGAIVQTFEEPARLSDYVRLVRQAGAEVVHLHVWERTEELMALGRLAGVPLALSYHHVPPKPWRTWAGRVARLWRMPEVVRRRLSPARHVDAHVGCCRASALGIRGELWPLWQRRVHCVPNGVPLPDQTPGEVIAGPLRLVQVGALVERKDPEATLHAFAAIAATHPEADLTFVGDGPLRVKLETSARGLGHGRVRFAGEVDDVRPFYRAANVLILPSRREGLPYSLLEGAAHGLALIATDVGGNREVAIRGRNALLVARNDVEALQRAVAKLALERGRRSEMGRNGRALVRERFTIERHVDLLLTLYSDLVSGCRESLSREPTGGGSTRGRDPREEKR